MITAIQITKAPPAATAITSLRGPASSDDDTRRNSSKPLRRTAAIGNTAFSAQLIRRLRITVGATSSGCLTSLAVVRIGVETLITGPPSAHQFRSAKIQAEGTQSRVVGPIVT